MLIHNFDEKKNVHLMRFYDMFMCDMIFIKYAFYDIIYMNRNELIFSMNNICIMI